jgi:hypothetical protein
MGPDTEGMVVRKEEWRRICWAPGYEISSLGRVGSWLRLRNFGQVPTQRRILKPRADKNGYRTVVLRVEGVRTYARVATLVCEAWHGRRPVGLLVRHLDGSKSNNVPDNLQWGTAMENSQDCKRHGTVVFGESVNTAKLTEKQVLEVLQSSKGHSELSRELGVTPGAIWHIRAGRTWKHLEAV